MEWCGVVGMVLAGRWGYPDMMQVGQLASHEEDRAHFSAWCASCSLTL